MAHQTKAGELLEWIKKNPGLSETQIAVRWGKDVRRGIHALARSGLVVYREGYNALTCRTCRLVYPKEAEGLL